MPIICRFVHVILLVLFISSYSFSASKSAARASAKRALDDLKTATRGELQFAESKETAAYRFVRARGLNLLQPADSKAPPEKRAASFLMEYGAVMGMNDAERQAISGQAPGKAVSELRTAKIHKDALSQTHVRFKQFYQGLPVFGAEVTVHMNDAGIVAVNGNFVPDIQLSTKPALNSAAASRIALNAVKKEFRGSSFKIEKAELAIYRTGLLEGYQGRNLLAYAVIVSGREAREQVWIDANTGAVLNRISLRHSALYRVVYSPQYDPNNPNLFVLREEGGFENPLPDDPVDNLYDFSGQVYHLFLRTFGRDAYDAAGAKMRTVYLVNDICPNAYWDGSTTNYCPDFDRDDVVAHEWGHAYTEYTHNLIYSYQSGALNESYSDIWGETLDLINGRDGFGGSNNQQPSPDGQRWLMGEDLVTNGALRDMWDPTQFGDPDKVSSANYFCGSGDGGGVHTNSGVPNHAFTMLIDGKTFNGHTVQSIGLNKAAAIYFRAQTVYQIATSNFVDHADALEASCDDLQVSGAVVNDIITGLPSGESITANDCAQVAQAMLAVEMRTYPEQCNYQPILAKDPPAVCPGAQTVSNEGFESGLNGWTLATSGVNPEWPGYNWDVVSALPENRSGSAAFAVDEREGTCAVGGDISGQFSITSPPITLPQQNEVHYQIRFDHYVETELGFDGGNLQVSVNGGAFTLVPQSAYLYNAPKTQLLASDENTNPKAGEFAWHGTDEGTTFGSWGTTIVSLHALAQPGQTIRLRYDFGIDGCNGITGWYVDNVHTYSCAGSGPPEAPVAPQQEAIQDDSTPDQINGVDQDGKYRLSWTYSGPPVEQPCGFQVQEASFSGPVFTDNAESPLVAGENGTWSGNQEWISSVHPDTATLGYSVAYIDNLNTSLTLSNALLIPDGHSAVLSFDSFEDFEPDFDFGHVEVSTDGGTTYDTLQRFTGFTSGRRSANLSAYAGHSVLIRFRLTSDEIISMPNFLGWFIDNIQVDVANFSTIGTIGGTTYQFDVTGRTTGSYSYRIAGLFGNCSDAPETGPYSNVQQIAVEAGPQTAAPTALFTAAPNPANVNQNITFDGSGSHDNDAVGSAPAITSYFWSFGDGMVQTTSVPTVTHAYAAEGSYRATLTVTDNDGETAAVEHLIEVTAPPPLGTKQVTGAGHITIGGNHANFSFTVEQTVNQVSGDFQYNDKAGKTKVQSEGVTSVTFSGKTATFSGPCTINKNSGFTFTVEVTDNGEPGSKDNFRITLSNGYEASGNLTGGNIKIKK